MSQDLALLSASQLIEGYRRRAFSPVEVLRATLDRIERYNAPLNAFAYIDAPSAIAQAEESERRWQTGRPAGLLDGIPTTIKDLMHVRGWVTRSGSMTTIGHAAEAADSPPVARLREHGAVLIGKTCVPEFGWQGVTESPVTGSTLNPWNIEKSAGGSSGGAAVCCAAGFGALHTGTDGGGSIRIPSAFCGTFGLKPTFGRVPAYPLAGLLSHQGPMTRTTADAALMMRVLALPDARDWHALPSDNANYELASSGMSGLKIAYCERIGPIAADEVVIRSVRAALAFFRSEGAHVEELQFPDDGLTQLMADIWAVELAVDVDATPIDARAVMDKGLLRCAAKADRRSAVDLAKVLKKRAALGSAVNLMMTGSDVIICPQVPFTAFDAGREYPSGRDMSSWLDWAAFAYAFNLTGQPAASVPCGFDAAGMPLALQIIGHKNADRHVLQLSAAFERAFPFRMPELGTTIPRAGSQPITAGRQ